MGQRIYLGGEGRRGGGDLATLGSQVESQMDGQEFSSHFHVHRLHSRNDHVSWLVASAILFTDTMAFSSVLAILLKTYIRLDKESLNSTTEISNTVTKHRLKLTISYKNSLPNHSKFMTEAAVIYKGESKHRFKNRLFNINQCHSLHKTSTFRWWTCQETKNNKQQSTLIIINQTKTETLPMKTTWKNGLLVTLQHASYQGSNLNR